MENSDNKCTVCQKDRRPANRKSNIARETRHTQPLCQCLFSTSSAAQMLYLPYQFRHRENVHVRMYLRVGMDALARRGPCMKHDNTPQEPNHHDCKLAASLPTNKHSFLKSCPFTCKDLSQHGYGNNCFIMKKVILKFSFFL